MVRVHTVYSTILLMLFFSMLPYTLAIDFGMVSPPDIPGSGLIETNTSQIIIVLKDPQALQVQNAHISTILKNVNYEKKTLEYTESGNITLNVPKGTYNLIIKGDALATTGGDYYYEGSLTVTDDTVITVRTLPVGSLRGTIINGDTVIPNALIKFDCSKNYGSMEEIHADEYGSFSNDYLPIGECRVHAKYNDRIGYADVTLKPGTITNLEINLSKQTAKDVNYLIFAGVGMFLLIIVVVFLKFKPQEISTEPIKPIETNRVKDLMSTLNDKEKKIVTLLVEQGELYQNKIVYETNIPKTSLVRILMGLEQKHIIESKQIGKTKKFKATNWFLNSEIKPK